MEIFESGEGEGEKSKRRLTDEQEDTIRYVGYPSTTSMGIITITITLLLEVAMYLSVQ